MPRNRSRRTVLKGIAGFAASCIALPTAAAHGDHDTDIGYTGADTPSRDGDWNQLPHNRVYLYYKDGYRADAEQLKQFIEYAEQHSHDLIEPDMTHGVEWYVYSAAEHDQWKFGSTAGNNAETGVFSNYEIYCVAPSEHDGFDSTEEMFAWYRHQVTYEYFQVLMERVVAQHRTPHVFFENTAEWFRFGVPEYAALYATPDDQDYYGNRDSDLYAALSEVDRSQRYSVLDEHDQRIVGAELVRFIRETYGWEVIMSVLQTPAESFEASLQDAVPVSAAEFEADWLAWVDARIEDDADGAAPESPFDIDPGEPSSGNGGDDGLSDAELLAVGGGVSAVGAGAYAWHRSGEDGEDGEVNGQSGEDDEAVDGSDAEDAGGGDEL